MRRIAVLLLAAACIATGGLRARAGEEPFAFPLLDTAKRMQQRHLRLVMQGQPAGGVSARLGYLADGRVLFEARMALQMQRENDGKADVFRIGTHEVELLSADGRVLAARSSHTEADVVETTEAVYAAKHVDVTHTGPGGTYRKRLDVPADHASEFQVQRDLLAAWKPGTEQKRVHSRLSAEEQRFEPHTTTLLGKTTYMHDGVAHPALRFRDVDDEGQTMEMLLGEDFLPFEVSMFGGAMKATWVNEPTLEVDGGGWSMSSFVPVDHAVSDMLKLESLEIRLVLDPPQAAGDPALLVAGPYQAVVREPSGYRVTLAAQRVPKEAGALSAPMKIADPAVTRFLTPTPAAQSDHAEIIKQARQLAEGAADAAAAVRKIVGWVWAHVEKESGARGTATALEVLQSLKGDCSEHAVLVVALCRAAGIPARAVGGIEYLSIEGRPLAGYHAWAEVWLGRWVPVDATIPEVGTSARYMFLHVDEPGESSGGGRLGDLITRKVRLEVLAWKHEGGERVVAPKPAEKPAGAPVPADTK